MFSNLIYQFLFIFSGILTYLIGGLIGSMALIELKPSRKYIVWLLKIILAFIIGFLVMKVLGLILGIVAGLISIILLLMLKKTDLYYFIVLALTGAILLSDLLLIEIAVAGLLLSGILDYEKYNKSKKKNKVMMIHKSLYLLIFSGILVLIVYFLV